MALDGAVAGVKIGVGGGQPVQPDVRGQIAIDPGQPGKIAAFGPAVEMDNLAGGMDAGIGAPGANHRQRLGGHPGKRFLHPTLERGRKKGLALPTRIVCAVVFQTGDEALSGVHSASSANPGR